MSFSLLWDNTWGIERKTNSQQSMHHAYLCNGCLMLQAWLCSFYPFFLTAQPTRLTKLFNFLYHILGLSGATQQPSYMFLMWLFEIEAPLPCVMNDTDSLRWSIVKSGSCIAVTTAKHIPHQFKGQQWMESRIRSVDEVPSSLSIYTATWASPHSLERGNGPDLKVNALRVSSPWGP